MRPPATRDAVKRLSLPTLAVVGALAGLLCASASVAAEPELPPGRDREFGKGEDERAYGIQRAYQEAGREIGETHAEALRQPELREPIEEYRRVIQAEMIRLEPSKQEAIIRRHEVHEEMQELGKTENPTEEDKRRFQELGVEYSNLTETLDDLPKRVAKTPKVREASEKFRKEILAVMTKLNPKIPELMEQQREALSDYTELERELLMKHGGRSEAVTPAP